jgi:hypothetical protein
MVKPDHTILSIGIPTSSAMIIEYSLNIPRGTQHDYQSNNLNMKSSSIDVESLVQHRVSRNLELVEGSSMKSLQLSCQIVFRLILRTSE